MGSRTFKGQRERDQEQSGGINHPQPTLPPSRHCHSDPNRQIEPSRKRPFGQLNTKNASCSGHKAHTPAFEWREAARCGRGVRRALTAPLSFSPSPSPHPAPTITVQSQAPEEAEIENTFSLKHSLNFMNSITLDFLSISWSEHCKTREKGDDGGAYTRQQLHATPLIMTVQEDTTEAPAARKQHEEGLFLK